MGPRRRSEELETTLAATVDEVIAAVENAGAVVTKAPGDPIEFAGRNA